MHNTTTTTPSAIVIEHPAASVSSSSSAQAFALVLMAAAATGLGASVVFCPALARFATKKVLAVTLGFAAGVMLYVSLVDIYGKSINGFASSFQDDDDDNSKAFIYASLTFFGGILLMKVLNTVINTVFHGDRVDDMAEDFLDANQDHHDIHDGTRILETKMLSSTDECQEDDGLDLVDLTTLDVDSYNGLVQAMDDDRNDALSNKSSQSVSRQRQDKPQQPTNDLEAQDQQDDDDDDDETTTSETSPEQGEGSAPLPRTIKNSKRLYKLGAATAVAIALHNFPEGLITYLSYMEDPAVGISLAVGIALHNIPEGLTVAMPIYYATGGNCRVAFSWGILSGISEPVGALLGWLVLRQPSFSGVTYGIMFGLVAGIMTYISLDELLPMAYKYGGDGGGTGLVFPSVVMGMFLIAASLMLFSV